MLITRIGEVKVRIRTLPGSGAREGREGARQGVCIVLARKHLYIWADITL
jgi:hypothetical protein